MCEWVYELFAVMFYSLANSFCFSIFSHVYAIRGFFYSKVEVILC